MDSKIAQQILDELAPTFERIESQSAAMLQYLKEKGIASDEQLAPYLEEASAASSVRWRALRVRMGRLLSMAEKNEGEKRAIEDEKRAEEVSEGKSAKKAGSTAQVADAKKDKLDRAQEKAPGWRKRAEAGDQDAGATRRENHRDLAGRPKESAEKQDTGLTSSEGSGQAPAESAPDARKRNDAA